MSDGPIYLEDVSRCCIYDILCEIHAIGIILDIAISMIKFGKSKYSTIELPWGSETSILNDNDERHPAVVIITLFVFNIS